MVNSINDDEIWNIIGFIRISSARYITLEILQTQYAIPSDIVEMTKLTPAQVSSALKELKEKKLIKCMNDTATKGRIYHTTPLGEKSYKMVNEYLLKDNHHHQKSFLK